MVEKFHDRFLSLDVFRGMTICFMIIVNTPGSGATPFAPLMHATWNGLTPTDLVFPSFLFAVGNAMSFSHQKYIDLPHQTALIKILKRAFLIFLLGYLLYWFPFFKLTGDGHITSFPISQTRIMGVLQRIALCYLFASLLLRYLSAKKIILISLLILIGYWAILLVFGDRQNPFSLTGNACMYLDKFVFNETHLYHENGVAFDPEGILGTLPAIVNVIIGFFAGKFIQEKGKGYESMAKLLLIGALFIFVALCWNMVFPINKSLWTSPFVLITTGIDLTVIGMLIYFIEIKPGYNVKWVDFFVAFGKNPLFIYIVSAVIRIILNRIRIDHRTTIYEWINIVIFQKIVPGPIGSLLFALCFVFFCWGIVWYMDKRKIYVRV